MLTAGGIIKGTSSLSVSQVDEAVEAGAKFIVTPGFDEEVVEVDIFSFLTNACFFL